VLRQQIHRPIAEKNGRQTRRLNRRNHNQPRIHKPISPHSPAIAPSTPKNSSTNPRRSRLDRAQSLGERPQPPIRNRHGLAADIQRHLSDEPVIACPPTWRYRSRKFAKKHRGPVIAAAGSQRGAYAGCCWNNGDEFRSETAGRTRRQSASREAAVRIVRPERARRQKLKSYIANLALGQSAMAVRTGPRLSRVWTLAQNSTELGVEFSSKAGRIILHAFPLDLNFCSVRMEGEF